ncbi:MAG: protein kinase [Planctomycetota bacterium]|nr:protein kinase [Planctomycetota bacterium]
MSYLLLACPKCHAAYKIAKEFAASEVTCRSCGHRWVPAALAKTAAANEAAPAPPPSAVPPQGPAPAASAPPAAAVPPKPASRPAGSLDALESLAQAAAARKAGAKSPAAKLEAAMSKAAPGDALAAMADATKARAAHPQPAPRPQAAAPGDPPDPLVGTAINGFRIIKRIGSGGFGVVYHAFDTSLERSVAIKMLPPKIAKTSKSLVDRFLREARSAAKLSHPNIVTIHQICPYKDTFYIVMELVEGGALHERLVQKRRFEPVEATRIIRAAAEGLGHAHRRGIIHRDIKPGNIMLTNDGQVKVSDFGLARDVLQGRDIIGPGHSLGTPRYMAPEQALGDEPTASSDLYSLAATYYALLTGRAPFDATSDRELMKKQVTEDVPDPRQFVPELPVAVFRFFERAMAKQPEERYLTAEEFVEALDRLDFSMAGATGPITPQALSAQIGRIAPEDRGSHLTEALGRVVKRAQRERTPTPGQRLSAIERAATPKRDSWLILLLIVIGAVIVIGGAIAAAFILANRKPHGAAGPTGGDATPAAVRPGGAFVPPALPSGPAPEPGAQPPVRAGEQPAQPPSAPAEPANLLEDAARAAFDEVKKLEADPRVPREDVIAKYEENVLAINAYAKTKAAEDARKAIARLQGASDNEKPK